MSTVATTIAKQLGLKHNVAIRVLDEATGQVVAEHQGHNAATNSLLTGIGHFLAGEGVLGQGEILRNWIPQYISLGTMGLMNQDEDENGLPAGIGNANVTEEQRFSEYILQCPGFGSDGYDVNLMNNRRFAGLGPKFADRPDATHSVNCELITDGFKRSPITFRDVVPEYESEYSETIDVVFSALISTGALAQFREPGKDYIFITEVGLWSSSEWNGDSGENGLLAGYRICPPDESNWDMSVEANREILKKHIIKVKTNQIVQVIWKIQLGGVSQLTGLQKYYPAHGKMEWNIVL